MGCIEVALIRRPTQHRLSILLFSLRKSSFLHAKMLLPAFGYSSLYMLLVPLQTPLLKPGDDLAAILIKEGTMQAGDIVVISSKAVATVEGAMVDLQTFTPSTEAEKLSEQTGRSPAFNQAMLEELQRLHGSVISTCPGAALTELRPSLVTKTAARFSTRDDKPWSILIANAGLDESNAPEGFAIGWPVDPVASVRKLRGLLVDWLIGYQNLKQKTKQPDNQTTKPSLGIILSDSCCRPRRLGVTAFALAVSGLDPLQSQKGKEDLFGKSLRITTEAVADQLATAANFLMGNAGQSVPAVIIRDHGLTLSEWEGWVPGIEPEEDLFRGMV